MLHTFAVYVDNKPGVLNRVSSLFRRRAFNIESLTVGHTETPGVSRMTVVVDTDAYGARRLEAHLYKLVPCRRVDNITDAPSIARDLAPVVAVHRFDLAELTSGLGTRFETMQVSLKFYSCVSSNHTTLDAIRAIRARRSFSVGDVDHIVVHGSQVTVDHVGWKYRPEGISSAQLNLPFCVATLLLDGEVFVDQFTALKIVDPVRIALADKVEVVADPEIVARGSEFRQMVRVEIFLKDGTILTETVETPRGSERNFASKSDVVGKFENLAGHAIPRAQVAAIQEAVLNLETLPDSSRLANLLTKQ
jgi:acetolactate synthase small subunit